MATARAVQKFDFGGLALDFVTHLFIEDLDGVLPDPSCVVEILMLLFQFHLSLDRHDKAPRQMIFDFIVHRNDLVKVIVLPLFLKTPKLRDRQAHASTHPLVKGLPMNPLVLGQQLLADQFHQSIGPRLLDRLTVLAELRRDIFEVLMEIPCALLL